MDYDSVGRFSNEKAKKMIAILRQYVPHIHWDFEWGDGELSDVMKFSDIYVPEYQLEEAEYVIGLLENGEDLSNYRSSNRFPVLFEEVNGNFHVVKPVSLFAENARELINLAEGFPGDDIVEYLRKISHLLIRIYALQFDLPDCAGGFYYQPWLSFSLPQKLDPFAVYYDVGDPFVGRVDVQAMGKRLEYILDVLHTGMIHYDMYYETGNYKYLSLAASVWKNQYTGEYGWGAAVVNALKVIHYAGMYLQKGKLPEIDSRQESDYEISYK